MTDNRTESFQKNELLEKMLFELNSDLQPSEAILVSEYVDRTMDFPLILVMGPLRSGTTLFTQWLSNTGLVTCPTNLLSRFYQAPIIGAKIQLLLTDPRYNFRDELGEFMQQSQYQSENGKTQGILAPNEFWYFWRRFLAESSRDVWSDEELRHTMDVKTMKAELLGMMDVFQKPFAAKGMLFNYNIPYLNSIFDKVLFVQIKRDTVTNVASVLDARKRQLGSESSWYSFQIPEYDQLKNLDSIAQAAGQVYYIGRAVTQGLVQVDESRKLVVQYEDFCDEPMKIFSNLAEKIGLTGAVYDGPKSFRITRDTELSTVRKIENALRAFMTD